MTCDDAIVPLNDRLDGEIDPAVARALDEHLAGCADCRAIAADLERLHGAAQALPREVAPTRDLWAGIATRITPPQRRSRRSWENVWLAAAAVLIAVGASALTAVWLERDDAPVEVAAVDWQRDLDEASAELRAALAAHRDEFDPATLAVVDENLLIIDQAIEDTRRALESAPDDETLRRSLVAVNEQKITLLRRALALPRGT